VKTLDEIVEATKELPEELQTEVRDFAKFLNATRSRPKQKYLRQTWAGALREYRDKYTSLELQNQVWGGKP